MRLLTCLPFAALLVLSGDARALSVVTGGKTMLSASPTTMTVVDIEFYLDRTEADDGTPLEVGNYQIRFRLSGPGAGTAVRIQGAGETLSADQATTLDDATLAPSEAEATEVLVATLNLGSAISVADGAGLARIELAVAAGAVGLFVIEVVSGAGNTEFTDPANFSTLLPIESESGELQIVPEPGTSGLLALGLLVLARRRDVTGLERNG